MGDCESENAESYVDLLIIGAGPAGLMTAAWASQYNINARLIDDKNDRVQTGQADGLHSRTLEIMHSFGIAENVMKGASRIGEICSWNPDPDDHSRIIRTERALSQPEHLSIYPQISLHQGRIEQHMLDLLDSKGKVSVERNTIPVAIQIDGKFDDQSAYPIEVVLKHSSNGKDSEETVRAKYVLGADGAHSWTRHQLGIEMEGDKKDQHFGVMDIVPLSDFPDMRQSCVIHSETGSVMTVPRENRLLRMYVQLGETGQNEKWQVDKDSIKPETILQHARSILQPYKLDFGICDWHSMYTVGQRLAPTFDHKQRIFLAGDAVHTHSPTLGQGMNVSMQDAYNLGWKICSVVSGMSPPEILSTYTQERRNVAEDLIQLDKRMTKFYSNGPSQETEEYQFFRDRFSEFLSGVAVTYEDNVLVASPKFKSEEPENSKPEYRSFQSDQALAKNIHLGQRLPSHKVVYHAEANVVHVHDLLPSNGKWRIVVLAGNIDSKEQWSKTQKLGDFLQRLCSRYSEGRTVDSAIEFIMLHAGTREKISILDLHEIYHQWDDTWGWDYSKVLSDDASTFEPYDSAYEKYGVDKDHGCVVILRPDQHVSYLGPVDQHGAIEDFFSRVLIAKQKACS